MIIGVSIMLFGMNLMSDSIQKLADNKLEMYLYKLTFNKPKAVFFGFISTAVVQSSAAVSSITVSFVDSSLIKLRQATHIILGAILGTAATGFIVAFSSLGANNIATIFSAKTLIAIFCFIGIIFKLILKNKKSKKIGDILLSFAVIMFGITTISSESVELNDNYYLKTAINYSSNEFIAVLSGLGLSALFQSASAAVGFIQSISISGLISFKFALSYLVGVMIGSSLPVLLFAAGKSKKAKISASIYLIINLLGAIIVFILHLFFRNVTDSQILNSFQIAVLNFFSRLVTLIAVYPLTDVIEKRISIISFKRTKVKSQKNYWK